MKVYQYELDIKVSEGEQTNIRTIRSSAKPEGNKDKQLEKIKKDVSYDTQSYGADNIEIKEFRVLEKDLKSGEYSYKTLPVTDLYPKEPGIFENIGKGIKTITKGIIEGTKIIGNAILEKVRGLFK